MCNHLSAAITVIVSTVTMGKYLLEIRRAAVRMLFGSLINVASISAAYNGWVIKPVAKSEAASPPNRIKEGVLRDGFLHIAATIKEFPATATSEERALITPINKAEMPCTDVPIFKTFRRRQSLKFKTSK